MALHLLPLLALFTVVYGSAENQTVVIINVVRMDSFYRPTRVYLSCKINGKNAENASYWRRLDGREQRLELTYGGHDHHDIFEVTPALEGIYFCKIHEINSTNEIEVVGECLLNIWK